MRSALAMLLLGVLAGCAGNKAAPVDPTVDRGWVIALEATDSKFNFFAAYELARNNVLTYVAGDDGRIAWIGQITDDEARAVIGLAQATSEPAGAGSPPPEEPGRRYTLRTLPPGAWVSTNLKSGPTPQLDALYDRLMKTQMAHRRDVFDPAVVKPVR